MKIILLHGDNIESSRKRLQKFIDIAKTRGWEIVKLIGGDDALANALSSKTLFGGKRLFILENPQKARKEDLARLTENKKAGSDTLVLYSTSLLTKAFINSVGGADTVEVFEYPKLIWNFLDSFFPGNSRVAITTFHRIVEREAPELVFALLARHLKDLYLILANDSAIKSSDWRKSKLVSQAKKFGEEKIKEIIGQMAEIDVEVKTSQASLVHSLDLLMITQLE